MHVFREASFLVSVHKSVVKLVLLTFIFFLTNDIFSLFWPGVLVAYCHRFDVLTNSSSVYFIASTIGNQIRYFASAY